MYQKSNSVGGDLSVNFKRPGTASNLDFNRGMFNVDEAESSNQIGLEDDEAAALNTIQHRPRTS